MDVRTLFAVTALVLQVAATATAADAQVADPSGQVAPEPQFVYIDPCLSYRDDDRDGIDDGKERCVLARHAPVLYMPLDYDWTLPANVDWYLTRTALRFHHNNCSDDQVVPIGQLTQTKLILQSHHTKQGFWDGCDHTNTTIFAQSGPWNGDQHFFLQPNDSTHRGSEVPTDWKVYGHVYRNSIAGINVQYWFFYAYNDNVGSFNHEGDWESITVRLRYDETIDGIYFCAHGDCSTFWTPNYLTWVDGTHPVAWVADGSHATYPSLWKCQNAPWWAEGDGPNCQQKSAYRWWTWPNGKGSRAGYQGGGVINVGERGAPLNGQHFIRYYSRWGELGTTSTTSGPRTPSYQNDWLLDAAS